MKNHWQHGERRRSADRGVGPVLVRHPQRRLRLARAGAALTLSAIACLLPGMALAADPVSIVSLGDSYTSGNGAGDYATPDSGCHRSLNSYPWRVHAALLASGQPADPVWPEACSGAVVANIPRQIRRVPADRLDAATVVLLTIGGNDLHFTRIVTTCLVARIATPACGLSLLAANAGLDGAIRESKSALRLAATAMPRARVTLVGYPQLTSPRCDSSLYNRRIGNLQASAERKQRKAIDELNAESGDARFWFASVRPDFKGHGPCASTADQLVHDIVFSPYWESFHPTRAGHQTIGDRLISSGTEVVPPGPIARYPGRLVTSRGAKPSASASWLVRGDLTRLLIADPGVYACLRLRGFGKPDPLSKIMLSRVPDLAGFRAACGGSSLMRERQLVRNTSLTSDDGQYGLVLEGDGNLVLHGPAGPVWSAGVATDYLRMQADGDLVAYRFDGTPAWSTGTAGSGADTLVVQGDGNLVLTGPSGPVWSRLTGVIVAPPPVVP